MRTIQSIRKTDEAEIKVIERAQRILDDESRVVSRFPNGPPRAQ